MLDVVILQRLILVQTLSDRHPEFEDRRLTRAVASLSAPRGRAPHPPA